MNMGLINSKRSLICMILQTIGEIANDAVSGSPFVGILLAKVKAELLA